MTVPVHSSINTSFIMLQAACRLKSNTFCIFLSVLGRRQMRNKSSPEHAAVTPFWQGPCSQFRLTFLHAAPHLCSICSRGSQWLPVSTSKHCCCSSWLQREPPPTHLLPVLQPTPCRLVCVLLSASICAALTRLSLYPVKSLHRLGSPGGEIHISKTVTAAQSPPFLCTRLMTYLLIRFIFISFYMCKAFCLT